MDSFGPRTLKTLTFIAAICTAGVGGLKSLAAIAPLLNDIVKDICLFGASGLLAVLGYKINVPIVSPNPPPAKGDKP